MALDQEFQALKSRYETATKEKEHYKDAFEEKYYIINPHVSHLNI